jgi:hypothetical protein
MTVDFAFPLINDRTCRRHAIAGPLDVTEGSIMKKLSLLPSTQPKETTGTFSATLTNRLLLGSTWAGALITELSAI